MGDIDNRVKTIIDALRKPANANELRGNEAPQDGETPFFCLLEDDKLISHFAVETDTLLEEVTQNDADNRKTHVVITVEIHPYGSGREATDTGLPPPAEKVTK